MKFVRPLDEAETVTLEAAYRNGPSFRLRQRAHAVLLSARGFTVPQLCRVFGVWRNGVIGWLDSWEEQGLLGLYDRPRSGRPLLYTDSECQQLKAWVDQEPRQLKQALAKLAADTGKQSSPDTLARCLKKRFNYVWKRCRRTLKPRRDAAAFRREQEIQTFLHQLEGQDKCRLYYFDEAGFSTVPCVPYAWQPKGETRGLDSHHSKRINVLGFLNRQCQGFFHTVEGKVGSQQVMAAVDAFAAQHEDRFRDDGIPAIVMLDNASVHRGKTFTDQLDLWGLQGVFFHFLPTYSPELNLIEMLWRRIKYDWLPLDAYRSFADMKHALMGVLSGIGEKHTITFA